MREALARGDAADLSFVAHSLKGISAQIGVVRVAALSSDLERLGQRGRARRRGRPPHRAGTGDRQAAAAPRTGASGAGRRLGRTRTSTDEHGPTRTAGPFLFVFVRVRRCSSVFVRLDHRGRARYKSASPSGDLSTNRTPPRAERGRSHLRLGPALVAQRGPDGYRPARRHAVSQRGRSKLAGRSRWRHRRRRSGPLDADVARRRYVGRQRGAALRGDGHRRRPGCVRIARPADAHRPARIARASMLESSRNACRHCCRPDLSQHRRRPAWRPPRGCRARIA